MSGDMYMGSIQFGEQSLFSGIKLFPDLFVGPQQHRQLRLLPWNKKGRKRYHYSLKLTTKWSKHLMKLLNSLLQCRITHKKTSVQVLLARQKFKEIMGYVLFISQLKGFEFKNLFFLFICFIDFHDWHKDSKSQSIIISIQKWLSSKSFTVFFKCKQPPADEISWRSGPHCTKL